MKNNFKNWKLIDLMDRLLHKILEYSKVFSFTFHVYRKSDLQYMEKK